MKVVRGENDKDITTGQGTLAKIRRLRERKEREREKEERERERERERIRESWYNGRYGKVICNNNGR
jgi:hypothetical protein